MSLLSVTAIQTNPLLPPTLTDCDANAEGRDRHGYRRPDINRAEQESLIKLSRTDTNTRNLQIFPNLGISSFTFWFRDHHPFFPLIRPSVLSRYNPSKPASRSFSCFLFSPSTSIHLPLTSCVCYTYIFYASLRLPRLDRCIRFPMAVAHVLRPKVD